MTNHQEQLAPLRARLDELDQILLSAIADRIDIIRQISGLKKALDIPVMQPERVKTVLQTRTEQGVAKGLKKSFVERIWRLLIAEACRIENETTNTGRGELAFQGIRIDHVAIAVKNLDEAVTAFRDRLGMQILERWSTKGEFSGMQAAVLEAGEVTFVLVEGTNPASNVCKYIEAYGPGVQHVAIEVDDIAEVRECLLGRGFTLIGDIYDVGGLKQMFSDREPSSGMQIELISRGSSARFEPQNVADLFRIMEAKNVF